MKIVLMPGDGIGPEQMNAAKKVLYAIKDILSLKFELEEVEAGDQALAKYGKALPDHTLAKIEEADACLKAPIGSSASDVIVYLRRKFDLYANLRPAKTFPNIKGLRDNIDMLIVRENTEDLYAGLEYELDDASIAIKVITRKASLRIADTAFKLAMNRRKRVHAVHKANLLRKTDGLFAKCCREVAEKYDVEYNELLIDAAAMNLIRNPEEFDVIVTMNMFGDILSDEAAQVVGSLGIAPSANIGDSFAIFEPVHGSAPDIAGKGIANPISLILSAKMMFEWLSKKDKKFLEASKMIEDAVYNTLRKGIMTPDINGSNTTDEVTDAIINELRS
ncbi:MAG: 3-isopropylmalate dehydrogenase [Candidatus Nitrosocaldaceae archaeon]|nr:MAG: 3-isopropylmalate dehydrogenase [Candidatus Nitrosocaldaceae archaeon]